MINGHTVTLHSHLNFLDDRISSQITSVITSSRMGNEVYSLPCRLDTKYFCHFHDVI